MFTRPPVVVRRAPCSPGALALPLLLIITLSWVPALSRAADSLRASSHPAITFSHSGDVPPHRISVDDVVVRARPETIALAPIGVRVSRFERRAAPTPPPAEPESLRGPPHVIG